MTPTVIRVTEPRELLAFIPFQLGFRPTESLVAMALRFPRNEVGLVARLDLAALADPSSGAQVAAAIARHLDRDGAAEVLPVIYSACGREEIASGVGMAGRALAQLRSAFPDGVLKAAWLVSPTGYAGVDCTDEDCCPSGGRPLEELESTQVGAQMVLEGAMVARSRDDLEVRRRASAAARRMAGRAAARERARRDSGGPSAGEAPGSAEGILGWSAEALERWDALRRRAARGGALPVEELGRLLVALEDVLVRDALILALVRDSGAGGSAGSGLDEIFRPGGSAPGAAVLRAARAVLEEVVAHAPARRTAPALTVLGWLAWWAGDGARAAVLVGQARQVDAGYRLALLLDHALAHGVAPGWARPLAEAPGMPFAGG